MFTPGDKLGKTIDRFSNPISNIVTFMFIFSASYCTRISHLKVNTVQTKLNK